MAGQNNWSSYKTFSRPVNSSLDRKNENISISLPRVDICSEC